MAEPLDKFGAEHATGVSRDCPSPMSSRQWTPGRDPGPTIAANEPEAVPTSGLEADAPDRRRSIDGEAMLARSSEDSCSARVAAAVRRGGRRRARATRRCSDAAASQLKACEAETADDFAAQAICRNGARARETNAARRGARDAARRRAVPEQRAARVELCAALGGGRYAPISIPPTSTPTSPTSRHPNPYFPLPVGTGGDTRGEARRAWSRSSTRPSWIEGVTCIVVNDRVAVDGRPSRTPTTGSPSARTAPSSTVARM